MAIRPEDVYQELSLWGESERGGMPTVARIAQRLYAPESTVRRHLSLLVERGWVVRQIRRGPYGWRRVQQFTAVPGHEWDEL